MQKRFFVIVPFDPLQVPKAGLDIGDKILKMLKTKPAGENNVNANFEESLQQLDQRIDQIVGGLNQIGIRAVPLNDDELVELFYNLYNPATTEKKGVEAPKNN